MPSFQRFPQACATPFAFAGFNYIDGAADDETTYRHNTGVFETCDLIPNVRRGVEDVDMSVT